MHVLCIVILCLSPFILRMPDAQAIKEVANSWETARGTEVSWSTNLSSRTRDADVDESGNITTKASKNRTIEDTMNTSKKAGGRCISSRSRLSEI